MEKLRNNNFLFKLSVVLVITVFSTSGFCAGLNSGRIFPKGKVFIYKGDQKVGEFSKEAPLANGALMECKGRCGVKLPDLYMVAEDNSIFSVNTDIHSRELYVRKGTVYFAVSTMDRTLVFKTDHGSFTTKQVLLNASADGGVLKGYVKATAEGSELGVVEGGSMVVSTFNGEQMIRSGNRIVLAQANPGGDERTRTEPEEISSTAKIGIAAGAVTALAVVLYFMNDSDSDDASPITP